MQFMIVLNLPVTLPCSLGLFTILRRCNSVFSLVNSRNQSHRSVQSSSPMTVLCLLRIEYPKANSRILEWIASRNVEGTNR